MPFKKGHTIATKDKQKHVRKAKYSDVLVEVFEKLHFDVPERIFALMPKLTDQEQVKVLLELMNYLYPKKSAVSMSVEAKVTLADIIDRSWDSKPIDVTSKDTVEKSTSLAEDPKP